MSIRAKNAAGFSMVELMVAITIGLIVLVGVTWAYLGNRETYVLNEEMARMHESARIALDVLRNRLRQAGNFGCLRLYDDYYPDKDALKVLDPSDVVLEKIQEQIVDYPPVGYDSGRFTIYGALSDGMGQVDGDEVASSNAIKVAGGISGHKLERFARGSAPTGVENPYMVIGDCDKAVLFKAIEVGIPESAQGEIKANASFGSLPVVFGRGAQIWGINVDKIGSGAAGEVFERKITNPIRKDLMGNPIYSLFYNGQELVEGVDDFRICVGGEKEITGATNGLVNIATLSLAELKKEKITHVEIDLVLSSIRPRVLPENTLARIRLCGDSTDWVQPEMAAAGATTPPSDRRLRRLFTASVALRSKIGMISKEKEN
jgi:type IV pilus assembly protein PilW